jgi:endo-1,4-beta-xylanase
MGNHLRIWQEKGAKLGQHDFQIVAVEGYMSSGEADVTVW